MNDQERDKDIALADARAERVRNASLGEFVEWLTAFAMCFRRIVVDGKNPEPDISAIARELMDVHDLPQRPRGSKEDQQARREEHKRVEAFVKALKPGVLADLLDELADAYRDLLRYNDVERLAHFHRSLEGDIAIARSELVRDLVRRDQAGDLPYDEVVGDREAMLVDCGAPASA